MKKETCSKKELNPYIESVEARQRNTIWPDVLRGSRSVDELLWKGARDAPMVQRIGAVILGLTYLLIGLAFFAMALEQRKWFIGAAVPIIFGVGGWFIRNALRK
jgi:fructose-1,6-bisphosphatase/inositol monophosphatase family enzyme